MAMDIGCINIKTTYFLGWAYSILRGHRRTVGDVRALYDEILPSYLIQIVNIIT